MFFYVIQIVQEKDFFETYNPKFKISATLNIICILYNEVNISFFLSVSVIRKYFRLIKAVGYIRELYSSDKNIFTKILTVIYFNVEIPNHIKICFLLLCIFTYGYFYKK